MNGAAAVLLVEDNVDDVELTRRAFARSRVANRLEVVGDGAESGPLPAVVLLDLKLPKVDGLKVLQELRADERTRLLPVVILTSSREERDLVEGYRLGANSYVRKPVDFQEFQTAVEQLGRYWLILNERPPAR
jgi:two-component system, response regulator